MKVGSGNKYLCVMYIFYVLLHIKNIDRNKDKEILVLSCTNNMISEA